MTIRNLDLSWWVKIDMKFFRHFCVNYQNSKRVKSDKLKYNIYTICILKRPFSLSLMFHRENNVCDLRALNFIVLWSYLGEKLEKFDSWSNSQAHRTILTILRWKYSSLRGKIPVKIPSNVELKYILQVIRLLPK